VNRFIRATTFAVAVVALNTTAAFAHTGQAHDDDVDYADPVLFDGEIITDCSVVGTGMIVWELTGSADVTYAELHVDEPEASVIARTGAPYIWITPRYDIDLIEADADRIIGAIAADARLVATICDEAGTTDATDPNANTPLLPVATGLAGAALGVIGSRRLASSRSTS